MSPPRTVVFDLGGVLVDWNPRYLYRQLLPTDDDVEWLLAEVTTGAWNKEQDRGRSWAEAVEKLSAQFPEYAELIAAYDERWDEMLGGAFGGMVEILDELRTTGVGLYALTNWSAEKFPIARERYPWLSWFQGIVVSGEEKLVKPDPQIYRVLLERYGIEPASTVYLDDVSANVAAARELGMVGLHVTGDDPERARAELAEMGLVSASRE
ncbi:HAD family phosphatase [Actinobacteria bacterium YIM 96077]|uniref:HAD family phosphatase n=1 Tax=Phytoactinopolyspora halophila TaxID=1981511 RepID=A0A329QR78_9ACTN|nr:HAD family phosphatase [Phytoactinopolyspora halophila]AYY12944.1 HAD family phosphatase [Actinobacteria bacterium YIM 96077]RAW13208.1 HAD family phosphatase [Phytoactinopolyspora halophila]